MSTKLNNTTTFFLCYLWPAIIIAKATTLLFHHYLAKLKELTIRNTTVCRGSDRVRQKMGNSAAFSREIMRQERSIGHFGKYLNTLCLSPHISHKLCFQFLSGLTNGPKGIHKQYFNMQNLGASTKRIMVFFQNGLLCCELRDFFKSRFNIVFIGLRGEHKLKKPKMWVTVLDTYIFMFHVTKKFQLSKGPLGMHCSLKWPRQFFDCHWFASLCVGSWAKRKRHTIIVISRTRSKIIITQSTRGMCLFLGNQIHGYKLNVPFIILNYCLLFS